MDCGSPEETAHGTVTLPGNATYLSSYAQYICQPNFKLEGYERRMCLENGSWSGSPPNCKGSNSGNHWLFKISWLWIPEMIDFSKFLDFNKILHLSYLNFLILLLNENKKLPVRLRRRRIRWASRWRWRRQWWAAWPSTLARKAGVLSDRRPVSVYLPVCGKATNPSASVSPNSFRFRKIFLTTLDSVLRMEVSWFLFNRFEKTECQCFINLFPKRF